jgi:hypothetical protein
MSASRSSASCCSERCLVGGELATDESPVPPGCHRRRARSTARLSPLSLIAAPRLGRPVTIPIGTALSGAGHAIRHGAGSPRPPVAAGQGCSPARKELRRGRYCRRRAATAAHARWSGSQLGPRLRPMPSSAQVLALALSVPAARPGAARSGRGRRFHGGACPPARRAGSHRSATKEQLVDGGCLA